MILYRFNHLFKESKKERYLLSTMNRSIMMRISNNIESKIFLKSDKLQFIVPIFFSIIISTIFSYLVFFLNYKDESSSLLFGIEDFFGFLNILIIIFVSILILFLFIRLIKNREKLAIKILVATFILSGILSTLLFVKLIFNSIFFESPIILIISGFVTYIGAYFAYLVLVEALSERKKNLLFIISSGALGSFVGVLIPVIPIIGISLLLSVIDLILIQRKSLKKILGESNYENMIIEISVSNKKWGIGIGDLTCYSMVVSNTLSNFGILPGIFSLILILIGSVLSFKLTLKKGRFPGLPITLILGLIPLIIMSLLR